MALFAPTLRVIVVKAILGILEKGILERGESHASWPIINRDSKRSSNESVVDDGKNRRLDGAGLWLLAYGDEPTVFAPGTGV
jgi:hypothetical protein